MAGTTQGGKRAAETNKLRYGKNFYARIGSVGGKRGRTGGFYVNKITAMRAGHIGGCRSKKGYIFLRESPYYRWYQNRKTGLTERFLRKDIYDTTL